MWRRDGDGTVYLYAPYNQQGVRGNYTPSKYFKIIIKSSCGHPNTQADGFCDRPNYHCNFDYGNDIERGAWRFETNTWYTIEQRIQLNTPGVLDGSLLLFGKTQKLSQKKLILPPKCPVLQLLYLPRRIKNVATCLRTNIFKTRIF